MQAKPSFGAHETFAFRHGWLKKGVDGIADADQRITVDIYDAFGKRVSARTIAVQDGFLNTVLDLNGELANGVYMVNIAAGAKTCTERLVIQK